jgi:hypothetical protein
MLLSIALTILQHGDNFGNFGGLIFRLARELSEVAVALPGELFDVELQTLSSPDFFDFLSVLS